MSIIDLYNGGKSSLTSLTNPTKYTPPSMDSKVHNEYSTRGTPKLDGYPNPSQLVQPYQEVPKNYSDNPPK